MTCTSVSDFSFFLSLILVLLWFCHTHTHTSMPVGIHVGDAHVNVKRKPIASSHTITDTLSRCQYNTQFLARCSQFHFQGHTVRIYWMSFNHSLRQGSPKK